MQEFLNNWYGILIIVVGASITLLLLSVWLYNPFFKRFYDLLLSCIFMPFFVVLFIPIAIAIHAEDRGPIFYCGKRIGKNGKPFKMIKFRSMRVNAPDIRFTDGSTYNGEDDQRVTKVGKLLRKTSLDEIAQIINVFLGQMSLIGPRPDPLDWLDRYTEEEKNFLKAKPGITGYTQAYFRNGADGKEKIKYDNFYANKISLFRDIKIFFKTIQTVLFKTNLYKTEDASLHDKLSAEQNSINLEVHEPSMEHEETGKE